MPRESFVWCSRTMSLRPRDEYLREKLDAAAEQRSPLPSPMVIRDSLGGLNGLVHPATGERYDSKAAFRAETKARGLTEVGNDAFPVHVGISDRELRNQVAQEIADTYDAIEAGAHVVEVAKVDESVLKPGLAKVIDA